MATRSTNPPLNDAPQNAEGKFNQSWSAFFQDQSKAVGSVKVGTTTNDNAAAGNIGEFVSATVSPLAAVALFTGIAANVTTISLSAGDWDVSGVLAFLPTATTSYRSAGGGISLTSLALPDLSTGAGVQWAGSAQIPVLPFGMTAGPLRVSIAATTTVYLTAMAAFTVSTLRAYGSISARRMR